MIATIEQTALKPDVKGLSNALNEHVCEVRFKPNARIIDRRGEYAEILATSTGLPKWKVAASRVEVHDEEETRRGFFGHRNAGFEASQAPTHNYFADQAAKFIRTLVDLPGFGPTLNVLRIGLRSRFCIGVPGDFDELVRAYSLKVWDGEAAAKSLGLTGTAKLIDVGTWMKLADDVGKFTLSCGPITDEEAANQFPKRSATKFPEVNLYLDIDYFDDSVQTLDAKGLVRVIHALGSRSWQRAAEAAERILGG